MRFSIICGMALRDYWHERALSLCAVLALATVLAPLLILFGVRNGVISNLQERLLQDPRNLEIVPVGSGKYGKAFFEELRKRPDVGYVVPQTRAIAATIEKLAKVNTTVLITGESGVGKNVVARLVHHLSDRTNGPLVEINCAGIPAPLLESELFGYEAGAFTGASHKGKEGRIALADKGTLFLDEIGELPLRLQSKLLQVIQEKQIVKLGGVKPVSIDFRLVAATNQDLEALVEKKRFRSDLFFRLNVLPLWIPPLRERREEIVPLCLSILGEMNAKYGTEKVFSDEVKRHLAAYSWPGNIRELRNVIERLVIVSSGGVIKADELPEHMFRHQENPESPIGKSLPDALETLERRMILEAYKACGTTTGVAKALGISQPTAARKIAKYKNGASGER